MPALRLLTVCLFASGFCVRVGELAAGEAGPVAAARMATPADSVDRFDQQSRPYLRRLPDVEPEFGPETLADAWRHALVDAPTLNAGALNVDASSSSTASARAQYFPSASLGASYVVRESNQSFRIPANSLLPGGGAFPFAQREGAGMHAAVELPVYRSGLIRSEVLAREAETHAARHELAEDELSLKLQIAIAFVEVLRAEARLQTAAAHLNSMQSHLHDVSGRHQRGQVAHNDLLIAEVSLSETQLASLHARAQLDAARAAYNRLLRRPLSAPVELVEPGFQMAPFDLQQATHIALSSRPELARVAAEIEVFEHQGDAALAANRLHVSVQAGYDFQENRYQTPQGLGSVGVNGVWKLFDGGRARAEHTSRQQRADGLAQLRHDLELQIQLEVKRAWIDCEESRRRLELLHKSLEQTSENLRGARKRYQGGQDTRTDVLRAEAMVTQSLGNLHDARFDLLLSELRLRKAIGSL